MQKSPILDLLEAYFNQMKNQHQCWLIMWQLDGIEPLKFS